MDLELSSQGEVLQPTDGASGEQKPPEYIPPGGGIERPETVQPADRTDSAAEVSNPGEAKSQDGTSQRGDED